MFCSKCGAQVPEGGAFCTNCGAQVAGTGIAPLSPPAPPAYQQPTPPSTAAVPLHYAGFWLRFVAYIIDSILLGIVVGIFIVLPLMGSTLKALIDSGGNPWDIYTEVTPQLTALRLLVLMATWLYYALLESSSWQATLGKKALGLKVTDMAGNRVTFGRASGRYFAKIISVVTLFLGFIMAGFTERKQALHDMIAGCLVVRQL
jgi:uncharacterized RDD family membrane protein YckC